MESIEKLRASLDEKLNMKVIRIIACIIVCYCTKVALATSMFSDMTIWVIAVAVSLLFYSKNELAIFAYAAVLFVSLAHINTMMMIVVFVLMLFMAQGNQVSTISAILLPITFIPDSLLYGWQFAALLFGICLMNRLKSRAAAVVYAMMYASLGIMTVFTGFGNLFYSKGVPKFKVAECQDFESYLNLLNLDKTMEKLFTSNLTVVVIAIAAYVALAIVGYYAFVKVNIGEKTIAFDVSDLIKFIVMSVLLIGAVYAGNRVFELNAELPIASIVIQGMVAYILSRPFVSSTAVHKLSDSSVSVDGKNISDYNAEMCFDKWDSIIGYEETKKELKKAVLPYTNKKEYDRHVKAGMQPLKGLLLFGPPGTGKTTLARAIANETKMKLIVVNASSFQNMYVGQSEKNLSKIFKQAREKAPCIICFDEIESFLMDRSKAQRSYETSIVSTFLSEMDGVVELKNVLIIATTNNPTLIEPAALRPGRFDKLVYVGVPDIKARAEMFRRFLDKKTESDIDYMKLAEHSERYSGADIRSICESVYRENDFKPVTEAQLIDRLAITRATYTLEMKKMYELWGKKYNRSTGAAEDNKVKSTTRKTWDDIKGMDQIKSILKEKIELPIQNAEEYKKYGIDAPKGILFFGPPGCGKTFFAKVVADECNAAFYTVNGPELLGRGIGESEDNLRKLFMNARETKPSIIFFDEIDAIAENRGDNSSSVRIINQLLTEMDGMESLSGVTVIAATNRPEKLDPALIRAGRFDTKIYIPMPDTESIRQMLIAGLDKLPCEIDFESTAVALNGYTCADIASIVNTAKVLFVKRMQSGSKASITDTDMSAIINRIKPSVSSEDAAQYEKQKEMESWI